jgi:predicted metal-dependent hydrolase
MEQIRVSDITIDVVRKDIKNLHLGVYPPAGRVRIAAPLRVTDEAVRLFAISKIGWIKKHQHGFEKQERQAVREYVTGESHYFNGKRYLLNVITDTGPSKVHLRHKYIDLHVKELHTAKQRAAVLEKFYRAYLKEIVPGIIAKAEQAMGVKLREYNIKKMKTKWGTCNIEEKRIWLNLELAKKNIESIEYIIVHEMVHLLERHHNERFMAYMDRFLPQWKDIKSELNSLPVGYANWEL